MRLRCRPTSGDCGHGEALEEAGKRLVTKRRTKCRTKWQVREERRAAEAPQPAVIAPLERTPIRIVDADPSVHRPAGPEHRRAVPCRLPQGVTDGLVGIDLCLGKAAQNTDSG